MAPPVGLLKDAKPLGRKGLRSSGDNDNSVLSSRDATPTPGSNPLALVAKNAHSDAELANLFKSDLTNIKSLVTCSICDQLLYEPWTLGCGHTYCYSCLCNWFVPNRTKKTCPECRTAVKQMPAPAFLIKQMVEIFTKRSELMPSDESIDQHNIRRTDETADVERDRSGPVGLFKGSFPERGAELRYDEADGVYRCSSCGHEHEGGPMCEHCGAEIDDEGYGDFSDVDADDLEDLEDLEVDLDAEFGDEDGHYFGMGMHPHPHFLHGHINAFHNHHHHHIDDDPDSYNSENSSMGEESDEEDDSSLQDFIVRDGSDGQGRSERQGNYTSGNTMRAGTVRNPVPVDSDDESDEGGAISNRRSRRNGRSTSRLVGHSGSGPGRSIPSEISITDSTNSSEMGDYNDEATMLRDAGWSPLDQENDTDTQERLNAIYHPHFDSMAQTEIESQDESDTDTTVGRGASDDDDDETRDLSETPDYDGPVYRHIPGYGSRGHAVVHMQSPQDYTSDDDQAEDDDSDTGLSSMDHDGDTEMSVSPGMSRGTRSVSISTDGYNQRGRSVSINPDVYGIGMGGEPLGVVNEIHELDESSSDSSIRPAQRRRPRTHNQYSRQQTYNPRVRVMLAEHQQSVRARAIEALGLEDWDTEVRRIEPASRTRRTTPYRLPPRRLDPLRNSHSPSAIRIVLPSERASRPPREYVRRLH